MQDITSLAQFNQLKAKAVLIIDFHAHWCGPCKAISPVFDRLAAPHDKSRDIVFAKVDVDAAKDVAQACGITAMPTFQFFKKGTKVDEIRGADVQGLTNKIRYYVDAAVKANASEGVRLGESRAFQGSRPVPGATGNLRSLIDLDSSKLLNASSRSSVKTLVTPSFAGVSVDSLAGPQLLIHLCFTQAINLTSIKVSIPADATSHAPSKLHVGTNINSPMDLNALIKAENLQSFDVYSDEYVKGTTELKLKSAKFRGLKTVTILIDTNLSSEVEQVTRIAQIELLGSKA